MIQADRVGVCRDLTEDYLAAARAPEPRKASKGVDEALASLGYGMVVLTTRASACVLVAGAAVVHDHARKLRASSPERSAQPQPVRLNWGAAQSLV